MINFSQLPPPNIIETIDYEDILQQRKNALIELFDGDAKDEIIATLNRESEPLTKFIEENCYREIVLRHRINVVARSLLLAYATDRDLDHLAANFGVQRLLVTPATPTSSAVYESDDDLRKRTQQAFDKLSVAGPEAAYRYHSMTADGRVADVSVISPQPAYVTLTVLQRDSETGEASEELLEIVKRAVNDERVRPIADRVTVQSAQVVNFRVEAKIFTSRSPESATVVETALKNVQRFVGEERRLGRPIRISALHAALHIAGVQRLELIQPTQDIAVNPQQVGHCTDISVTFGGFE